MYNNNLPIYNYLYHFTKITPINHNWEILTTITSFLSLSVFYHFLIVYPLPPLIFPVVFITIILNVILILVSITL